MTFREEKMSKKPKIYMSRCFGFDKCRYDGKDFFCDFAENLKKHAEIIHWCPEIAIDLGCPREKIRVIRIDEKNLLFQPETGKFWTEKMLEYSNNYLETLINIDGFFLKAKSPSCGVKNTKLFEGKSEKIISYEASGFFAERVLALFPDTPVLTEEDLKEKEKTQDFLKKVFLKYGRIPACFAGFFS